MSLPINSETLAAAYDYLRSTPPFINWNLPESEDIGFKTSRSRNEFGRYQWDGNRHTITASIVAIGHTQTLMLFMAHEMIHLHLEETKMESRTGGPDCHNAAFQKFATQVCKIHGFDGKAFY